MARTVPVVWVENKGIWFPGLLLAASKSPMMLLENGEKRKIRQDHIRFESGVMLEAETEKLCAYSLEVEAEAPGIEAELAELWQLLQPNAGSPSKTTYSAEELASFLGDPETQPVWFDAIRLQLYRGSIYFRSRSSGFSLVEAHAVEQRERQQRAQARAVKKIKAMEAAVQNALDTNRDQAHSTVTDAKGSLSDACALLALMALDREEHSAHKEARKLLEAILGSPPANPAQAAFDLLVRLGVYEPDELLDLHREEIRRKFPADALSCAEEIRQTLVSMPTPPPCAMFPVTIDDSSSMDLDDAVALEETDDGTIVHVMITDVVGAVAPNSPTALEAELRASTLYLPDQVIPIFPPSLSEDALSLLPGRPQQVIDFQVRLGKDGRPESLEIVPTCIEIARRMTYDEVDTLLATPKSNHSQGSLEYSLHRLREIALELRHHRNKRGAFLWSMDEYKIQKGPDDVSIQKIDPLSPARILVQELMVLVGWMTASYGMSHEIPLIYRLQKSGEAPLMTARPSSAEIFSYIVTMSPATLSATPGSHEGLGVPAYVQVTSPLRRFQDYLSQLQIRSFLLSGTPAMERDELMATFQTLETQNRIHKKVMREAARYWILKYYAARAEFNTEAVVLQTWAHKVRLAFMDTGFQMDHRNDREIPAGTTVGITILGADPRRGQLQIRIR